MAKINSFVFIFIINSNKIIILAIRQEDFSKSIVAACLPGEFVVTRGAELLKEKIQN